MKYGTTVNLSTVALYRQKLAALSASELVEIAALGLYHLQVVSGSRNSFDYSKDPVTGPFGFCPVRTPEVAARHADAAEFIGSIAP